jgi:hypothetical protein
MTTHEGHTAPPSFDVPETNRSTWASCSVIPRRWAFAQVNRTVRDRTRRTGLMAVLGDDHVHATLAMAVAAATSTPDGNVSPDLVEA